MNTVAVIIPAFNEASSISQVLADIPGDLVQEVIVVDNNSTDTTAAVASQAGATVLKETFQGYGAACLKGISYAAELTPRPEILVFLDADYSDYPQEMNMILDPVLSGQADMVIGSRVLGNREQGAMLPQQVFGNWLATRLIKLLYGFRYTDLGPFRAIRFDALMQLGMRDKTFGWTVEMQIKAIKRKQKIMEVPVSYRKRIGVSKITGTVKGTILAGYKIILTILKYL